MSVFLCFQSDIAVPEWLLWTFLSIREKSILFKLMLFFKFLNSQVTLMITKKIWNQEVECPTWQKEIMWHQNDRSRWVATFKCSHIVGWQSENACYIMEVVSLHYRIESKAWLGKRVNIKNVGLGCPFFVTSIKVLQYRSTQNQTIFKWG